MIIIFNFSSHATCYRTTNQTTSICILAGQKQATNRTTIVSHKPCHHKPGSDMRARLGSATNQTPPKVLYASGLSQPTLVAGCKPGCSANQSRPVSPWIHVKRYVNCYYLSHVSQFPWYWLFVLRVKQIFFDKTSEWGLGDLSGGTRISLGRCRVSWCYVLQQ
jgi:hypothetical protein